MINAQNVAVRILIAKTISGGVTDVIMSGNCAKHELK